MERQGLSRGLLIAILVVVLLIGGLALWYLLRGPVQVPAVTTQSLDSAAQELGMVSLQVGTTGKVATTAQARLTAIPTKSGKAPPSPGPGGCGEDPRSRSPAPPSPEAPEAFPMPPDHGRGLDDRQGVPPARPPLRQDHPEHPVPHPEA